MQTAPGGSSPSDILTTFCVVAQPRRAPPRDAVSTPSAAAYEVHSWGVGESLDEPQTAIAAAAIAAAAIAVFCMIDWKYMSHFLSFLCSP